MTGHASSPAIDSMLQEHRVFAPPPEISSRAAIGSMGDYRRLCQEAAEAPDTFWATRARDELFWKTPFGRVSDWAMPNARWFLGGQTNLAYNCLDRHLPRLAHHAALRFEGEPGDQRVVTYGELHREVCRLANALRRLGVAAGQRVGIYLPLGVEAVVAMLACARIGAVHSVVFGGFSAEALRERMNDAEAVVILTADGGWRKGSRVALLENVRMAMAGGIPTVHTVVVAERIGANMSLKANERAWSALVSGESDSCEPTWVDSEHPLFILYTSGSTGKPKGILHTTAGYAVWASLSTRWVFDLRPGDVYWCTADVGWVTGHTYVAYGPLLNGATVVLYEGGPTTPQPDRYWDIVERHQVNILYTAPTALRALMRLGDDWPRSHNLQSLRILGTVGEPINPEAWMWYRDVIGGGRCPIVDTWWQTETGGIMISPLPGATPTKPGSATLPLPGVFPAILDASGGDVVAGGGKLFLTKPWPAMARTIWRDDQRYAQTYFSEKPGLYFTGDGARRDADGYWWILGRVDDVVNVAGHRLGTAEIESALVSDKRVAEAAVVGRADDLKGTALVAFVTVKQGVDVNEALGQQLKAHVVQEIGAIARPDEIRFAAALPKTRSGKIMRRLLRDVAAGRATTQDTTTLEDLTVLAALRDDEE